MKDHSASSPLPFRAADLTWLTGLAHALLHDGPAAEDLVQETVIAALERSPQRGSEPRTSSRATDEGPPAAELPPRAWLASVARRLAARRFRSESRRKRREASAAREEALPSAADLASRAETAEHLVAAARRLPEPFQRTILLRFLNGESLEEIARSEGKPVDTVRRRQRRGLALLREDLVRRHDRDWSAWSVLLLPIARPAGNAGLVSAGVSGSLVGTIAITSIVKATICTTLLLSGAALWFVWPKTDTPVREASQAAPAASVAGSYEADFKQAQLTVEREPSLRKELLTPSATQVQDGSEATIPARSSSGASDASRVRLRGRVLNHQGNPVARATVYLTANENSAGYGARNGDEPDADSVHSQVTTDTQGVFRFLRSPEDDEAIYASSDVGVVANGFVRGHVANVVEVYKRKLARARFAPDLDESEAEIVVRLERGAPIVARVVDSEGWPVPDLELVAFTAGAGLDHGSPSQVRLRAQRRKIVRASSDYHQSLAKTDSSGVVTFYGLPGGTFQVLALDAGWTLDPSIRASAEPQVPEWLATRCLGVVLTALDPKTGERADFARATFRVRLTELDGTEHDLGQWVGRGAGEVSLALRSSALGEFASKRYRKAVFYGEVGDDNGRVDWEAAPLEDPLGVSGVAKVTVRLGQSDPPAGESEENEVAPPPSGRITLDVRYDDDMPLEERLVINWHSRSQGRNAIEGRARPTTKTPGQYLIEVPAGDVELSVNEYGASGSLDTWRGQASVEPDGYATVLVTLVRGATARLRRPVGWKGQWYVHASYRTDPTEEWFGSWNYGTHQDELVLNSLRGAEWRFRLRRFPEDLEPIEHRVTVEPGVEVRVE